MEVSAELAEAVDRIRQSLPCSIELPAGAGKTELIAALATSCAERGERTLLLTHTNAGVDALRNRVRKLGGTEGRIRIRTIDSWCFNLIKHFPQLAELHVPDDPDWDRSADYERATDQAIQTSPIERMLRASYDVIVVDEYQDCVADQHAVVLTLSSILPTAILGDPLQALFGFSDSPLPDWEKEVRGQFPPLELPMRPWRWETGNRELGRWLFEIRSPLSEGQAISLDGAPVTWIEGGGDPTAKTNACFALSAKDETVVALGVFRSDCAHVAKGLNGSYGVMEELEGKALLEFADVVDAGNAPAIAEATVQFALSCAIGVADAITPDKRRRLGQGKPARTRKAELQEIYSAVNGLLSDPGPGGVRAALVALAQRPAFVAYCREAWYGMLAALEQAAADAELTVRKAVAGARNRSRIRGRLLESRVVSRPRLAKGLEFDHAILLDADRYTPTELYVALTRGRKSVTVVSKSRTLLSLPASGTAPD